MCGIAGFLSLEPIEHPSEILHRMTQRLEHRGPDDVGYFQERPVFLGHRRLSIVDLAGGHQPLYNETGDLVIVYNGEIFNHADLRPELEAAGHRYATRSDTETIVHAYEQYGEKCLEHFRGMFAFVLWDRRNQRLFAARDRLGIKPFYYYWDGRRFVFASEIKALLEFPTLTPVLNEALLPEHLCFGYTSSQQTLFRGIHKLMPGHHLTIQIERDAPKMLIERYWDVPPPADPPPLRSDREWIEETRQRMEQIVRMRLMSDVPLGMFLSGGVDSSAIAALLKRMADGPVKTFSVGYRETAYSELSYAAETAAVLGTEHHEVSVSMDDFFQALPKLIWHEDEPVCWPSSVSLYFVSKLAAQQVKVVLTGEGADELFAGYVRYYWTLENLRWGERWNHFPTPLRRWVRRFVESSRLLGDNLRRKLGHTFLARDATIESLLIENFYAAFSLAEQQVLCPHLAPTPEQVYGSYRFYWNQRQGDLLQRMLYADQKTYLVELLMKQDQMSMACSIESRVPLLDHTFVAFAASIPPHLKIRGKTQKYILKEAVKDLVPSQILTRRKMGFPTPVREWFLSDQAQPWLDLLDDPHGLVAHYLDLGKVQSLIQRHVQRQEDATDRLWRLVNLQLWGGIFFGMLSPRRREQLAIPSGTMSPR